MADYRMSQHAWDEITSKLNEMAKENRLSKQVVCKTYNTATGMYGRSKNKTLANSHNDRSNLMYNCTYPNQGSKDARFR